MDGWPVAWLSRRSRQQRAAPGGRREFDRTTSTAARSEAGDLTPHALRHGVAYRMMNAEDGNTLYDVRNRLRHRSIQTTERVYDHLIER